MPDRMTKNEILTGAECEGRSEAGLTELTRRRFLFRLGQGVAGLAAGAAGLSLVTGRALGQEGLLGAAARPVASADRATSAAVAALGAASMPALSIIKGESPSAICREAVNALGGMKKFVKKGDVVVVKPNIGWDRTPELAANTNPEVVAELVKMALEAGASKVKVFDHTCNNWRACYTRSGIEEAAKQAGAAVFPFDEKRCRNVAVPGGEFIQSWPVFVDALECDVFINCPVAKVHGISKVTLGMKNMMGVIGGNRGHWHKDIHVVLADFLAVIKPHLTVIDGWRVMMQHGPTGGSPDYVRLAKTCIASADPVAADAAAAALFDLKPESLAFLRNAAGRGYGQMDLSKLAVFTKG